MFHPPLNYRNGKKNRRHTILKTLVCQLSLRKEKRKQFYFHFFPLFRSSDSKKTKLISYLTKGVLCTNKKPAIKRTQKNKTWLSSVCLALFKTFAKLFLISPGNLIKVLLNFHIFFVFSLLSYVNFLQFYDKSLTLIPWNFILKIQSTRRSLLTDVFQMTFNPEITEKIFSKNFSVYVETFSSSAANENIYRRLSLTDTFTLNRKKVNPTRDIVNNP